MLAAVVAQILSFKKAEGKKHSRRQQEAPENRSHRRSCINLESNHKPSGAPDQRADGIENQIFKTAGHYEVVTNKDFNVTAELPTRKAPCLKAGTGMRFAPEWRIMFVSPNRKEDAMLRAAIVFFIIAIVAFIFGATGIAGVSMEVGRMLLLVFLALAVISFLINLVGGRRGHR